MVVDITPNQAKVIIKDQGAKIDRLQRDLNAIIGDFSTCDSQSQQDTITRAAAITNEITERTRIVETLEVSTDFKAIQPHH